MSARNGTTLAEDCGTVIATICILEGVKMLFGPVVAFTLSAVSLICILAFLYVVGSRKA